MLRWTSRARRHASLWGTPSTLSHPTRGVPSCLSRLPARTHSFQVVLSPKPSRTDASQALAATLELPTRFYSQSAASCSTTKPAMSMGDRALARNYREQLESAPNDAELARLVFEDIREGGGSALSQFVASSIFSTLAREGSVNECRELVEYVWGRGMRLDTKTGLTNFDTRQYTTVLRVWDAVRQDGGEIEPSYNITALVAAVNLEQSGRVFDILDFMKAGGVDAAEAYGYVVVAACQHKQYQFVQRLLDYMHEVGDATALVYRTAIGWAVKMGENGFVYDLLRHMDEHDVDRKTWYRSFVMSSHKNGLHDQILDIFELMRSSGHKCDDETYEVIVRAAVHLRKHALVFDLLEMKGQFCAAEISTDFMRRIVGTAVKTQQHALMMGVLDYMHRGDSDAFIAYTTAVRTSFKLKQYDFVLEILRKMDENGLDSREEYAHVVMSFNKLECYGHVLRAFKAMRDRGYDQEERISKAAVRAAIKLDRHDDVVAICSGSGAKLQEATRLYSYALKTARAANKQALVNSILDHRNKTKTAVKQSINAGKKPATAAKAPRAAEPGSDDTGAVPAALAEYLEKLPNSIEALSAALLLADKSKDTKKMVPRILDHLLEIAVTPNSLYSIMLSLAKRHSLVVAITDHAAKHDVDFTDKMCHTILRSCARENDHETALKVRKAIQSRGLGITEGAAYGLIKCAAKMDEWDAVIDILSSLRSETFKPTIGMYTRAFNECSRRDRLSRAVDIYNVMPESLRAQLSGPSLRVVIRGHASSDRKELQLRASEIINESRHAFSPKTLKAIEEEVQHIIQEEVVRESMDAKADSKGIFGYFAELFKR